MKRSSNQVLSEHYTEEYYTRYYKKSLLHRWFVRLVDRREPVFNQLKQRFPSGGRLLDIGCGNGNFLSHAQSHFECTGFEVSKAALKLAKQRAHKATLQRQSIYELSSVESESYEVVVCFDVLEHVLDTVTLLQEMRRILKPDGVLAISVPNPNSIGKSLKGSEWLNYREPSHLWFFSVSQWDFMLKQAGLTPLRVYLDGLNDPPYVPFIPVFLQILLIKIPTQAMALLGFPLPFWLSENMMILSEKTLGFRQDHFGAQVEIMKSSTST